MNKKGFTLVEIIVGIAIGSILLAVAGSMIVSSYKTVYDTTDTDMDKRVVDSAAEVVRTDTQFCFDVRLVSDGSADVPDVEHEEGWHWIYVKDGQLYRDDQLLFDSSYYNNKSIKIKANIFVKNDVRVDFNYYLVDRNGKDVYSTRDTLLYLNIQADNLHKGIYNAENAVELSNDDINGNIGNTKYRLYFRSEMPTPAEPDTPPVTPDPVEKPEDYTLSEGMVTQGNYVTEFEDGIHKTFKIGSVVKYVDKKTHEITYWQYVNDDKNGNAKPNKDYVWRKMDRIYAPYSVYLKNDVVLYNGNYYRAKQDIFEYREPSSNANYWEKICSENNPDVLAILKQNSDEYPTRVFEPYVTTVQEKYWPKNVTYTEVDSCTPSNCKFKPYDSTKQYSVGSYVISSGNILYYKGFDGYNEGPGNARSGWIKLSVYYDPNSSYLKDDIVARIRTGNELMYYKQAVKQISENESMNLSGYWIDYTLK